jgi:micrococcal nuclease
MLRNVPTRVAALPVAAKVFLAVAALIVLALAVVLSPLLVILATLVLIVAVFALVIQLLRRGSLRRWGIVSVVASLMLAVGLMLAGCGTADSQDERVGKERGTVKATKAERRDPTPGADLRGKNEAKPSERESQPSFSSTSPGPENVLASQYQHINAGDYQAAYKLFDNQSQQLVSSEQYRAYFTSVAPYEITSYSFPSVRIQGETASLVVDLAVSSSAGQDSYRVTQRMVREDGSWRVTMREEQVASFTDTTSPSASASASASADHNATVTVSRVVDGDTIEISPRIGVNEEVRFIGIDTPETKDPSEGVEPYGPEASAFATEELSGQRVHLEFDEEREDQYGRLLAYVYAGGQMFNEVMLEEGYAQAYPYEPNTKYEDRFAAAQEEARAAGLGIWGLSLAQQCKLANRGNGIGEGTPGCEGATASSSASTSPSATPSASPNASHGAGAGAGGGGGNRNRGVPAPSSSTAGGDIDCDQINGPVRVPPGDPHGLDGDGDGWGCE